MADWRVPIEARQKAKTILDGFAIVGDVLDSPPAAGQERSWLQSWLDEAREMLGKIAALPAKQAHQAADAARALKQGLDQAAENAKEHAADLTSDFWDLGKNAAKYLIRSSAIGLGIGLFLIYLYFSHQRS
jgi:hypothetical protein